MKKRLSLIALVLALVLCFTLVLSACENNTSPQTPENPGEQQPPKKDDPDEKDGPKEEIVITEEEAIRAVMVGLTTDFAGAKLTSKGVYFFTDDENASGRYGKNAFSATISLAYDRASQTPSAKAELWQHGTEHSEVFDNLPADSDLAQGGATERYVLWEGNLYTYESERDLWTKQPAEGTEMLVSLFEGEYTELVKQKLGVDLLADWTFESLFKQLEDVPVTALAEMLEIFTDSADDEPSEEGFTNLLGVAALLGQGGTVISLEGSFVQEIATDFRNSVTTEVVKTDDGYKLTLSADFNKAVNKLIAKLREVSLGTVDGALKELFNLNVRLRYQLLKDVVSKNVKVSDLLGLLKMALGVDDSQLYDLTARVLNSLEILPQEVSGDSLKMVAALYFDSTLDNFIKSATDGEEDYDSVMLKLDDKVDKLLNTKLRDSEAWFIDGENVTAEDMQKLFNALDTVEFSANFTLEANLDGEKKLTAVDFDGEYNLYYQTADSAAVHSGGKVEASLEIGAAEQVTAPSGNVVEAEPDDPTHED